VSALRRVYRQELLIEAGDAFLNLEAKALIEQNSGVVGGHVKNNVFARTSLNEMVNEELGQPETPPIWVDEQEGDIGFCVTDVWGEKGESYNHPFINGHHAEIRMF